MATKVPCKLTYDTCKQKRVLKSLFPIELLVLSSDVAVKRFVIFKINLDATLTLLARQKVRMDSAQLI